MPQSPKLVIKVAGERAIRSNKSFALPKNQSIYLLEQVVLYTLSSAYLLFNFINMTEQIIWLIQNNDRLKLCLYSFPKYSKMKCFSVVRLKFIKAKYIVRSNFCAIKTADYIYEENYTISVEIVGTETAYLRQHIFWGRKKVRINY